MTNNTINPTYHDKYFTEDELKSCLSVIDGTKTFGDIDSKDVFHLQTPNKGTLGNLMEMSVLGMKQNSLQHADLEITYNNGITHSTELKTTGVHDRELAAGETFHAKECTSLTAVSIGTIEHEVWENSNFYNKLAHILWVFYFYKRNTNQDNVPYDEYSRFPVLGYKFTHLEDRPDDLVKFKNDWEKTKEFIIAANQTEHPEELYPLLHSSIKKDLFFIDIAPRYKKGNKELGVSSQTPRFRIKKSYVNNIFQEFWNELHNKATTLEDLKQDYSTFEDLENALHTLTITYRNKTIEELVNMFNLPVKNNNLNNLTKDITEQIVVQMMGGTSSKISNIALFNKIGIIAKTITVTPSGSRTEDTKLFTLDLEEIKDQNIPYEETMCYQFFNDYQFLCIVFEEPYNNAPLKTHKFLGFKRFVFSDDLIETTVRNVYNLTCNLINTKQVIESYCFTKDGKQRFNPNGLPRISLNFPKSKDYDIFIRGTGGDSSQKTWKLEGTSLDGTGIIHSYSLQLWVKGSYITTILNEMNYI